MNTINCKIHGSTRYVFCCQHFLNAYQDIVYNVPTENDDEAQIWCENCETARIKDKGWFDYADEIASWKIICTKCYEEKLDNAKEIITYE